VGTLSFTSVGFGLAAPQDAGPFFRRDSVRPPIADLPCTLALYDDLAVSRAQFDLPNVSASAANLLGDHWPCLLADSAVFKAGAKPLSAIC
jgi:hypothetical protein